MQTENLEGAQEDVPIEEKNSNRLAGMKSDPYYELQNTIIWESEP